ncbi:MAG: tyrosine-protein phosphatase [Ruminiclostridium sp.]|nr:tyrosine-protein phosphatase [Ruminiclostridium sp.]
MTAHYKKFIPPEPKYDFRPIDFSGIANARDFYGYITGDGLRIKPNTLIRSGHLHNATSKDTELLAGTYMLGTVIDFRSEEEIREKPDQIVPEAKYIHLPMLDVPSGLDAGNDDDPGRRLYFLASAGLSADTEMYSKLVFGDMSKAALKQFFGILLENGGRRAVLFHSTNGKDRAGVAAAMMLALLGFDDEYIIGDYLYTNTANGSLIRHDVAAVTGYTSDKSELDRVRRINGVQAYLLEFVLSKIRIEYGSVSDFAKESYGLSDDDINELKRIYLK